MWVNFSCKALVLANKSFIFGQQQTVYGQYKSKYKQKYKIFSTYLFVRPKLTCGCGGGSIIERASRGRSGTSSIHTCAV